MKDCVRTRTRVFWLGAHKVLKATELAQLRDMGFEVFNPAYISPIYDQSMDRRVDIDQPTTLPIQVFEKLIRYDFFYNSISEEIADILAAEFDAIIVTINADWLHEVLKVYHKRVIFRVYGQQYLLSEHAAHSDLWKRMIEHGDLSIVPFSAESIAGEHRWFRELCREIVPYQIADDVFALSGSWQNRRHRIEIATSIPNIENPYYASIYRSFCEKYPHRVFKIYGPQRKIPDDDRIVGALERRSLLNRFATASGYLYPYSDRVCYLPPIESMEIGTPVIYANGSLLAKFYDGPTPGLIRDEIDADTKIRHLIKNDRIFIREIVSAQEQVRRRYDRALVRPVFEQTFKRLLNAEVRIERGSDEAKVVLSSACKPTKRNIVFVFFHIPGLLQHVNGQVYAFEGIPRVVDILIHTIVQCTSFDVIITCTTASMPVIHDFFGDLIAKGRLSLHPVNCDHDRDGGSSALARVKSVSELNSRDDIRLTIIPHYYLFPEALLLKSAIALYLPDYFPHVMPGVVFDRSPEQDAENKRVGVAIAEKSRHILTNSQFTKSYLPSAGFAPADTADATKKIIVAPLPLLGEARVDALSEFEERHLQELVSDCEYIFYPTANRPNKQIAFLLRLIAFIALDYPKLKLVLTCDLDSVPGVPEAAVRYDVADRLVFARRVSDSALRWLYSHATALCLTTTLEGNFPPQVLEALTYGTPVVATRLVQITERIGHLQDDLLLCEPVDLEDFRQKLIVAMTERDHVLQRQNRVLSFLRRETSQEAFFNAIQPMFTF